MEKDPSNVATPSVKRKRSMDDIEESCSPSLKYTTYSLHENKGNKIKYSDPYVVGDRMQEFDYEKFETVSKAIRNLFAIRKQMMMPLLTRFPSLRDEEPKLKNESSNVIDDKRNDTKTSQEIITIDSDDDESTCFEPEQDVGLKQYAETDEARNNIDIDGQAPLPKCSPRDDVQGQASIGGGEIATAEPNVKNNKSIEADAEDENDKNIEEDDVVGKNDKNIEDDVVAGESNRIVEYDDVAGESDKSIDDSDVESENEKSIEDDDKESESKHDKGEYVGDEYDDIDMQESDLQSDINNDRLADIWKEMSIGLESSRVIDPLSNEHVHEDREDCDHSYILKEDIGYVCRVCGIIQRKIESIIEFQRPKSSKSIRTYYHEGQTKSGESGLFLDGVKSPETDFSVTELSAHPRHRKQMKPHQIEGFKFLLSNLMSENPGGCILAHAPGSGKTFMLISFIQCFMAKYPEARPLVILPRGIVGTWKKEFIKWQIEDLPLLDFYSVKADGRSQQLEVLKQWASERSILFLSYQQFSSIVCDNDTSSISVNCQEILLTHPSLLIIDEGHTPRNKDTNMNTSLGKVKTHRKVVLSGTLYQNRVEEVFNIFNLVRPKFFKMENIKVIKRRILSRVSQKNILKKSTDNDFYMAVEHTLVKDDNFKRKASVIEDLREMTSRVLHYYKGDFLDELPGLVDFSVFLKLTPKQKHDISELKKAVGAQIFKFKSGASAIYVHPALKSLSGKSSVKEKYDDSNKKIDNLLENADETGVKEKFFLNMLRLCESGGEKLLVFGQYLLPLKYLVKLTMKTKGWCEGKQIFILTGDHDNDERETAMDQFNNSSESRVFFGSIKACGEGISLVGASRIIILDVHLNPSVTRQAIGRAYRPGQTKKVYSYRLIAAESPEEEDHATCFRKESVSKMWFEWNEYCGYHDFEMETTSVEDCGDQFLETSFMNEDITAIYKR